MMIGKRLRFLALVSVISFDALPPVLAQEQSSADLAVCLLQHSGKEQDASMKEFLFAVLSEADQSDIQMQVLRFGLSIAEIAVGDCDVNFAELEGPTFKAAAEQYGELLGMRVMEDAMRGIGLSN